jgi:hypothetical protein
MACMCACLQIQKEEADYAHHIQNNWQQSSSSQQQQQRLQLNTLGAAQLINPSLAAKACTAAQCASQPNRVPSAKAAASAASAGNASPAAAKVASRAGSAVAAPAATGSAAAKAPAAPASQVSVARSSAGAARSTVSRASTRLTAAAPGSAVGSRVRHGSSIVGAGAGARSGGSVAGSAVSYPCTPNFSEVGSSVATSEVGESRVSWQGRRQADGMAGAAADDGTAGWWHGSCQTSSVPQHTSCSPILSSNSCVAV